MRPLCVFEHEAIGQPLSDAEKAALDRLRGPYKGKIFDVGWREVRASSFVGVVHVGQRVVQVLPKIFRPHLDEQRNRVECTREATANLLFLLSYTHKLAISEPVISRLTEQRAPLFEILCWIFSRQLWEAVRQEVLRGYVAARTVWR